MKNKLSFSQKLILAVSITIIIVLIINCTYFIFKIRDLTFSSIQNNLDNTVSQQQTNINGKLDSLTNLTNAMFTDYNLMEHLTAEYTQPIDYFYLYQYLDKFFQGFLSVDQHIHSFYIYSNNQSIPSDLTDIFPLENLEQNSKCKPLLSRGVVYLFVPLADIWSTQTINSIKRKLPDNRKNNICMLRMLDYGSYGEQYGVLCVELTPLVFSQFINMSNHDSKSFIIDKDNLIMASKNTAEIQTVFYDQNTSGTQTVFKPLTNGWKLVSVFDERTIIKGFNEAIFGSILLTFTVLVCHILVIYIIVRLFTHKLDYLNGLIKEVVKGNYKLDIKVMGEDEIDQIILTFDHMVKQIDHLHKEVYEKELAKKSIELELLHSQIKPHFLYNTLASMASLGRKYEDKRLTDMVLSLSNMYRISLSKGEMQIPLSKEIELCKNYCNIMHYRLDTLLQIEFDVDELINDAKVPKLIIQPFIENSINHGMVDENGIKVVIKTEYKDNAVYISVWDNGKGFGKETVEKILSGEMKTGSYGIYNIQRRIRLAFGTENGCGLYIDTEKGGTEIIVKLPYIL